MQSTQNSKRAFEIVLLIKQIKKLTSLDIYNTLDIN